MSKHKKTREEKIIADLRHQLYSLKTHDFSHSSLPKSNTVKQKIITAYSPAITIPKTSYLYLKHDVLKALILTLAIIAFQIILLFILKRHILVLPGIYY